MSERAPNAPLRNGTPRYHNPPVASSWRGGRGLRGAPTAAFSLLELVVVVALLVLVAGTAMVSLHDRASVADRRLAEVQMSRVRDAVQAFRADTGHWPGRGPFRLVSEGGATAHPAAGAAWFHSPLNLGQLLDEPLRPDDTPVMPFDPHTGRGWRGPYLRTGKEYFIDAGDGLAPDGTGDPATGVLLERIPAVPDLIERAAAPSEYLRWSLVILTSSGPVSQHLSSGPGPGRPIAILGLDEPGAARVVSFGLDGAYDTEDDIVLLLNR